MPRRRGPVYTGRLVGDDTQALSEVTAGIHATPAYGLFLGQALRPGPPEPIRRVSEDARRFFVVLGIVAAIAILCGAGLYAVGQAACPCTFGAGQAPVPAAPPTITVANEYASPGGCN